VADVIPFTCWRPSKEYAAQVAAAPYDTFSREEAAREIAQHPLSFLRIDKSAALFGAEVDEYDPRVYARARKELDNWYEQEIMTPCDPALTPAYYLYRLTQGSHQQTGLIACASVADYQQGIIKRHENTRAKKEADRVEHIKALEAHTGPVLLTYPSDQKLDALLKELTQERPVSQQPAVQVSTKEESAVQAPFQEQQEQVAQASSQEQPAQRALPLYDFVAPDGVRHEFWRVDDAEATRQIQACFADISTLYVADGHHRAAAAARIAKLYQEQQCDGLQEAQYFLVALFGSDELQVLDYNRVISDRAGHTSEELLKAIEAVVDIEAQGDQPYRPSQRGELSMYLEGTWYKLKVREATRPTDAVDGLDVALLHDGILAPLLQVLDPRSDARISYVGGARGLTELAERADESSGVAFALYPCSLAELFAVANEDRLMPPKSTWFEPKPRSGLAIHRIAHRIASA